MDTIKQTSLKNVLEKTECYTQNVAELAEEIGAEVIENGQVVQIDWRTVISLLQIIWDKVKESVFECENGKELIVKLPPGMVGSILSSVLAFLGIRL